MLAANYIRHFKVLGKLCKFYDEAATEETAQTLRLARTEDQVATGESVSLPGVEVLNAHYNALKASITAGPTAQKAAAIAAAKSYLKMSDFTNDLTTTPDVITANGVLTALATDMGAAVDNKTLSTETTSGLINFFDTIAAEELTWNDASAPDYDDATYVVDEIV